MKRTSTKIQKTMKNKNLKEDKQQELIPKN